MDDAALIEDLIRTLAIASNLGGKPFTPEERKDLAAYLYKEREWTMTRIAAALKVSQQTISNDLKGLPTTGKPSRPKGGRPKGSRRVKQLSVADKRKIAEQRYETLQPKNAAKELAERLKVDARVGNVMLTRDLTLLT